MSFADRHNKYTNWGIDTSEFDFTNLEKLYCRYGAGVVYTLRGAYINDKGNYGNAPVFILGDCLVNMPKHMTKEVENMLETPEDVEEIRAGKVGFSIRVYDKAVGRDVKTCYSIVWECVD